MPDTWKPTSATEIWKPQSAEPIGGNESTSGIQSFLDQLDPDKSTFLSNHPLIKRLLIGGTTQEQVDARKEHPIASKVLDAAQTPLLPGVDNPTGIVGKGYNIARQLVTPENIAYGAMGSANALPKLGTLGKEMPTPLAQITGDAKPVDINLNPNLVPKKQPLLLNANNPRQMIAGPSNNPLGQVAPANVPPDIAAEVAGLRTGGTPSPQAQSVNLGELAEQNRQGGLNYTAAEQYPGTRLNLPDKELGMPPQVGDTRGGINPITPRQGELKYPLNVVPQRLQPRAAQSDILQRAGMPELSPKSDSDITFESGLGSDIEQPFQRTEAYSGLGTARPGEPQLPSAPVLFREKISQAADKADIPRPPLDIVERISPVDNDVLPRAGQATPTVSGGKDVSALAANFNSPHKVLMDHPETVDVAKPILEANDKKIQFIATTERELADLTKGLDANSRMELFDVLHGTPSINEGLNQRRIQIKQILDRVHASIPDDGIGYLENYITHIQNDQDGIASSIKNIFDYHNIKGIFEGKSLGKEAGKSDALYQRGLGNPSSPFILERVGNVKDLDRDLNRVLPAYIESIAKVIYDKPAVELAKQALDKVPDNSILKELAASYIKNYTRYDSQPMLHTAWTKFANQLATTTARALINFNPGLHMLHLGEIPASLWPELGSKYTYEGFKSLFGNGAINNWQEMAQKGLLQSQIRPMRFQTPMQKWDSIGYFMSSVESLVKGIGYNGAKKMFLDQGMNEVDAVKKAIEFTKDATYTVDPARMMKGFTPESNIMGGEVASRLGGQFKQIPTKIIEQYMNIAANAKRDPAKATRLVAGASLALAGSAGGLHTFHLNPSSLATATALGAFGNAATTVIGDLSRGDWEKALVDTASWITPGGQNLKKLVF